MYSFFFFKIIIIFGYAGSSLLCGPFSSCGECGLLSRCGVWASHCSGLLLWSTGSRVHRLQQFELRALEHRLSCGTWTSLPCAMGDLPQSWIELVSSALAGGFFTTEPPGKPLNLFLMISINYFDNHLIKTIFFDVRFIFLQPDTKTSITWILSIWLNPSHISNQFFAGTVLIPEQRNVSL